jgi:hypothetical protein
MGNVSLKDGQSETEVKIQKEKGESDYGNREES